LLLLRKRVWWYSRSGAVRECVKNIYYVVSERNRSCQYFNTRELITEQLAGFWC
jgi:hypothetical protein